MAGLKKLFEKQITEIWCRGILEEIVGKKLTKAGVENSSGLVDAIVDHVLSGGSEEFKWDDGTTNAKNLAITFDDADLSEIDRSHEKFIESMPEVLRQSAEETAAILLKRLKKKWAEEHAFQTEELQDFRERLEHRWGKPIGLLRMLLTISRELGAEAAKARPVLKKDLKSLLTRLHVRACQVSSEIIVLLENGYADGAMARWRTLHEICVVMLLMKEHGEPLAQRYIDHQAVEAKRGKDQYLLCHEGLGYTPMSATSNRKIDKAYEQALEKYGKDFGGPYGWAAGFIRNGNRRLSLGDLEAAVGRSFMGSHYKLASYNVHAGPHALFFRLGLIDDSVLLAGASNAGLSEPGQNTAVTLALLSMLLIVGDSDFDDLVSMHMLEALQYEIPRAFARVETKLKADHIRERKTADND